MLALAVSCGSSSDISPLILAVEGGTSKSDDGSLTLEIPPGALAEDTEIRISRVAEADLNREDIPELAKYVLEPAGTVFSKPVRVELVLPLSVLEPGFELLNIATEVPADQEPDTVVNVEIDDLLFSDDGSEATLVARISHFSTFSVVEAGYFEPSLSVPDRAVVGVPFTATAITRSTGTDSRVLSKNVYLIGGETIVRTTTIHRESAWDLTGSFLTPFFRDGNLSPTELHNAPPKTRMTTDTFTSTASFTCQRAGEEFKLLFRANIILEVTLEYTGSDLLFFGGTSEPRPGYPIKIARASGECIAPIGSTPTPQPTLTPSPTPTPDPLDGIADIFLLTPTAPADVSDDSGTPDNGSSQLVNGMLVEVSVTQWNGNPGPTLKRSWSDLVNLLSYTLHFSVKPGPDPPPDGRQVEFQIFEEGFVFPFYFPRTSDDSGSTEVRQRFAGGIPGELLESYILPGPGSYSVKGTVGGEEFEINVEVVEPPVTFGALVKPGTWGITPLEPADLDGLVSVEGTWAGQLPEGWEDVHDPGVVLANLSRLELRLVDQFIQPVPTSVAQTIFNGTRLPFDLMLPRARYEGKLSFSLAARGFEGAGGPLKVCGEEIVTYELSGLLSYLPFGEVWAANLELTGELVQPFPKLAEKLPQKIVITATSRIDEIGRLRMIGPVADPISDTSLNLGLLLDFQDLQPNPASVITDESTCRSLMNDVGIIALLTFPQE